MLPINTTAAMARLTPLVFLMLCVCCLERAAAIASSADFDCTPVVAAVVDARTAFIQHSPALAATTKARILKETGINFMNDALLAKVVCQIAQARSKADLAEILNLTPEEIKRYYADFIQPAADPQFMSQLEALMAMVDEAFDFLKKTGFPDFPLALSEGEAYAAINQRGVAMFIFPRVENNKRFYTQALLDSQTLRQFVETTGTVDELQRFKDLPETLENEYNLYSNVSNLVRMAQSLGLFALSDGPQSPTPQAPSKECMEVLNILQEIKEDVEEITVDIPASLTVLLNTDTDVIIETICTTVNLRRENRYRLPSLQEVMSSASVSPAVVQELYRNGLQPLPNAIRRDLQRQSRFVGAAKRFMERTGYPDFPLSVSFQEAKRALGQTTGWAFKLILPGIVRSGDTDAFARAMAQAQSVEEFARLTGTEEDLDLYRTAPETIRNRSQFYDHAFEFIQKGQRYFIFNLTEN